MDYRYICNNEVQEIIVSDEGLFMGFGEVKEIKNKMICECGAEMIPQGGCFVCPVCGYSPCKG